MLARAVLLQIGGSGVMHTTCREEIAVGRRFFTKKAGSASWGQRSPHPQPATLSLVWPAVLARVSMDPGALREHGNLEMAQSGLETTRNSSQASSPSDALSCDD